MMDRVRRPWVASTSFPRFEASSRSRFIGAAWGETMATTLEATTRFPYPMLKRTGLLNVLDLFSNAFDLGLE